MARYSIQQKEAVINQYINSGLSIREFSAIEGISKSTLYAWSLKYNRNKNLPMTTSQYSSEQRFAFVLETATLSETELSQFCREKGLFPHQIQSWKKAFIDGNSQSAKVADKKIRSESKSLRRNYAVKIKL